MIVLWALVAACGDGMETPATPVPSPAQALPPPGAGHPPPGAGPPGPPPQGGPGPQPVQAFKAEPNFQLTPASGTTRSIVVISLDTVRADHLGVYGGRAQTPTLDAFAAQGVRFQTALTQFPETCLSHWSMLSGVLPEVHGNIPGNGGSLYQGPTLAELASHAGLSTGAFIGGITLQDQMCGLARGFDHYDDHFDFQRADTRPGSEVTAAAVDWIRQQTAPYFAFVHYFDAHTPYTPSPPWDTRYDPDYTGTVTGSLADLGIQGGRGGRSMPARDLAHIEALYDGELSELDALIAPVLAAAGDQAVVVVTSDHGESFEHDYFFNHRAALWEGVLRVPLLIRGPGVPKGLVVSEPVSLVDLVPTVTTLAGLPADARMQGVSRAPLLQGEGEGAERHFALTDPWMPQPQFSIRTVTHKVIWQTEATLVYNLEEDPLEANGTGETPPDLLDARAAYNEQIDSLRAHQSAAPEQSRPISEDTRGKLESLGYVDPARSEPRRPPPP